MEDKKMTEEVTSFKGIYNKYLQIFQEKIKDEYVNIIFNEDKTKRKELTTEHTKEGGEPEPLTEDIIKEMFRELEINPLDITRQVRIKGSVYLEDLDEENQKRKGKKEKVKKPDFQIRSLDPEVHDLLFEIEHLNKSLTTKGDGEGIEQAEEWYNLDRRLYNVCDSVVTNFMEWYYIIPDNKGGFNIEEYKPWEMLEIIKNIKLGRGRQYILEEYDVQKQEITSRFYNQFQERLKKILGLKSKIKIEIRILNYEKPDYLTQEEHEQNIVNYYRKIFSRLLFIKIIVSWKRLKYDPISNGILKTEKRYWINELKDLFFEVFNKRPEDRSNDIMEIFKEMPYLNGGLFRPSGIEIDDVGNLTGVNLNPEAVKDIWDFFKKFEFTKSDIDENSFDSDIKSKLANTIKPEILGYILERTIGDERKKTGAYYTPETITEYIANNTIMPYITEKINTKFKGILPIKEITDIDSLPNKGDVYYYLLKEILPKITICDPACGSGAFLEKMADKLLYLYEKCYAGCGRILKHHLGEDETPDSQMPFPDRYSIKRHILQDNLYGVDINTNAIEICELRLWLWVIKLPEELEGALKYIDLPALPNVEYNIRCGNSLIGYHEKERLGKIGSQKFRRIDEKYLSGSGSAIRDILKQKQNLISCYYEKDERIEESRKIQIRKDINNIVDDFKDQLNDLMVEDFQNQKIVIPLTPIYIKDYINTKNFRKKFYDLVNELNRNNELTYFKINFKEPVAINYKKIREIKGLMCSLKKNTEKVLSIYPTSSFNFKYYSEYGKNPFSKFLLSLNIDWEDVVNIEFKKAIGLKDILQLNPFYWVMEFPSIFFRNKGFKGFDIVMGNPPFVRADTEDEWFLLQRNLLEQLPSYENLWEKWDIFVAFIERSLKQLIKENGHFSFVVSDAICTVKYSQKLRNWIQENYKIPLIDYFEEFDVFKGIGINPILLFVKKSNDITETEKVIHSSSFKNISKKYEIIQNSKYLWKKEIPEILNFDLGKTEELGNICYISYGLRPNADEKIAKGEFTKNDLISDLKTEINNKRYVEGKYIQRYKINTIKYLEWGTERCPRKIARKTFPELYSNKKIIFGTIVEGLLDLNGIICNHSLVVFKRFIDLNGIENNSIKNSLKKNNPDKTREQLEEISNNYTYEYLLAIMNSRFSNKYLNAIRRHKLENFFYPDDFRNLPIKLIKDQTFFIKIVEILQFLYQSDGNKDIIQFLDNKLLNFIIYELYFEDKLEKEGLFQDLLNFVKDDFENINFDTWIKLKLKYDLKDNKKNQMLTIEESNNKIIEEIYSNIDKKIINQKIESIRQLDWIKKIEKK